MRIRATEARLRRLLGMGALLVLSSLRAADVSSNLLQNPDFSGELNEQGVPAGWAPYGGGAEDQKIEMVTVDDGERRALLLADRNARREIGLRQTVRAEGGLTYEASVEVRSWKDATSHGAYLQLRFLPSGQYFQEDLETSNSEGFERISVRGTAPRGTERLTIYLYTHRAPTPELLLRRARLITGVEPPPPPPSPPPAPVPPVYTKLKELHLETKLVTGGRANATLVTDALGAHDEQAERIQKAIEARTGIKIPIVSDTSPRAAVPIAGNLIALGNRSTNRTISELYNRFYTLLDLRYPGQEGYVVRSLHNPFGDARNVIFVGGSSPAGVERATARFVDLLAGASGSRGELSVGRIADIRLGQNTNLPKDVREFETWEASKGYGSVGYFGWNSISKRMAMFYMTGDEFQAREFLRLAFPGEKALEEISQIDGERIEDKNAPLSGPYHYNAHLMILFWDLIEESSVFTDEQRLRVTNGFAKQLNHRRGEGIYGLTKAPVRVGSRHGQWSAISLYCLGRYFQKDYPNPVWQHCVASAQLSFQSLHEHAWVSGENDNLFWYNTAIAPVFTYLLLTGDRTPVENGVLRTLLRGQEILISGRQPDWALRSASLGFLNKAAYLMQDGRYAHYRQRTGVDVDVFRLGQSFEPGAHLAPRAPEDLVGKWTVHRLPRPMWRARRSGLPFEQSFLFGSYRSSTDASGDFILIDGFNGASRNPYHTFALLELRLAGHTLLKGYRNQLFTRMDGLVEPHIAMNAALVDRRVLGATAVAVAEVPDVPFCSWRRALVQRIGSYALLADELTFRSESDNMEVELQWETEHVPAVFADGHVEFSAAVEVPSRRRVRGAQIRACDPMETQTNGRVTSMRWMGRVEKDSRRCFFSLLGIEPDSGETSLECVRVADNAASLALPSPALAVIGVCPIARANLALLAGDHLFATGFTRWSLPDEGPPRAATERTLLSAGSPLDVDWDFERGRLHIVAQKDSRLRIALASTGTLRFDGKELTDVPRGQDSIDLRLVAGEHLLEGARPPSRKLREMKTCLEALLAEGRERYSVALARRRERSAPALPELETAMSHKLEGTVKHLLAVSLAAGDRIFAAERNVVHVLQTDGEELRRLEADGPVRVLRWWPEHQLLLVGCSDEQVVAFDVNGQRKWVFTSEMDPAVYRAAKTYWFKSAPGHEGIHGLHTGVFLDGESQAFVGSACTLEILDASGRLIKRMPQFWGKVSHFLIVAGPDGSLNLLASRKYNGTNTVAIINNKTLDPRPRGFHTVPAGSTYVPGWSSMNRHHLFWEDLDRDGVREVISEINGTWNRVTVWRLDGKALYDASFGPGERIPARNMRALEIVDLEGDGPKEILAATSRGMVVALDHACRRLWASRLGSPPTVMKGAIAAPGTPPWIVVGCESGAVVVLDGRGEAIRAGRVSGRPTAIETAAGKSGGRLALLATDEGEVRAFKIGRRNAKERTR